MEVEATKGEKVMPRASNWELAALKQKLLHDGVLNRKYVEFIMKAVRIVVEQQEKKSQHTSLWKFYNDEMTKCVDILKLRKLALCRLGDPRYEDYRKKYFNGEE